MKVIPISTKRPLPLGRVGENQVTEIRFVINAFFPDLDGAVYRLAHKRHGDNAPYPCAVTVHDGFIDWVIGLADVGTVGSGEAQLTALVGDRIAKSVIFTTETLNSLGTNTDPPDGQQAWLDQVFGYSEDAEQARNAAQSAAASANGAAARAQSSASQAQNAAEQAQNAASSANSAAGTAMSAAGSANNAKVQAQGYASSALSAKNDAVSAKNDAVSAKNAAVSAKDAAVAAKNDAVSAKNAAVSAKEAAEAAAASVEEEIFWATYGTTTSSEISAAVSAGKEVLCKYDDRVYRLTKNSRFTTFDGDKLYRVFITPVTGEWNNDTIQFPLRAFVLDALGDKVDIDQGAQYSGKVLGIGSNGKVTPVDASGGGGGTDEVEWVTYGTTTSAQIETARLAGKLVLCDYNDKVYALSGYASPDTHVFVSSEGNGFLILMCLQDTWSYESNPMPLAATTAPADLGAAAAVGTGTKFARADHVHKKPTAADVGAIPAPAAPSQSDLLIYNGHDWTAGAAPVEIFWCTYGSTVATEIYNALYSGLLPAVVKDGVVYIYAYTGTQGDYYFGSTALKSLASQYCICSSGSVWSKSTVTLAQASDIPSAATAAPSDLAASAAVGSSAKYAKEDHVHKKPSAADVGAIPAPSSPSSGQFLVYNGSAWVAQTLATWQGGNY